MVWKAFITIAAIYFAVAWYGKTYGFGAQCEAAGYKNAALERCIDRKTNGGPTYEENAP